MGGIRWTERVEFRDFEATKAELWRGGRMFAGLNCFLRGQAQPKHAHPGSDKFYLVLSGAGTFEVGDDRFAAGVGELVPAPAGVPHAVRNDGPEPLVLLTVIAPPPGSA